MVKNIFITGKSLPSAGYYHYLHHKYFECNYGGDGTVPMDKWFGSFHDGTKEGHELMKQRRKKTKGFI